MNEKSAAEGEPEVLALSEWQLRRWWKKNGGKERSSRIEKPYLTPEHKIRRLEWANDLLAHHENSVFVHLDEKWFYTTSRRKQYKYLPLGNHEEAGTDRIRVRRVIHKSHPAKCMFMAAVTKPNEEHRFSGKIMMRRVSATRIAIRTSSNQQFSISRSVNQSIGQRSAERRRLAPTHFSRALRHLHYE